MIDPRYNNINPIQNQVVIGLYVSLHYYAKMRGWEDTLWAREVRHGPAMAGAYLLAGMGMYGCAGMMHA